MPLSAMVSVSFSSCAAWPRAACAARRAAAGWTSRARASRLPLRLHTSGSCRCRWRGPPERHAPGALRLANAALVVPLPRVFGELRAAPHFRIARVLGAQQGAQRNGLSARDAQVAVQQAAVVFLNLDHRRLLRSGWPVPAKPPPARAPG